MRIIQFGIWCFNPMHMARRYKHAVYFPMATKEQKSFFWGKVAPLKLKDLGFESWKQYLCKIKIRLHMIDTLLAWGRSFTGWDGAMLNIYSFTWAGPVCYVRKFHSWIVNNYPLYNDFTFIHSNEHIRLLRGKKKNI